MVRIKLRISRWRQESIKSSMGLFRVWPAMWVHCTSVKVGLNGGVIHKFCHSVIVGWCKVLLCLEICSSYPPSPALQPQKWIPSSLICGWGYSLNYLSVFDEALSGGPVGLLGPLGFFQGRTLQNLHSPTWIMGIHPVHHRRQSNPIFIVLDNGALEWQAGNKGKGAGFKHLITSAPQVALIAFSSKMSSCWVITFILLCYLQSS